MPLARAPRTERGRFGAKVIRGWAAAPRAQECVRRRRIDARRLFRRMCWLGRCAAQVRGQRNGEEGHVQLLHRPHPRAEARAVSTRHDGRESHEFARCCAGPSHSCTTRVIRTGVGAGQPASGRPRTQNRHPTYVSTALRSRWLLYVPPQVGTHAMSQTNPLRRFRRSERMASLRPSSTPPSPDQP